jgi:hypothetical protein
MWKKQSDDKHVCFQNVVVHFDFNFPSILLESHRQEVKKTQSWHMPYGNLKAHFQVKVQASPAYEDFLKEIETQVQASEGFVTNILAFACEAENLDKAQDPFC